MANLKLSITKDRRAYSEPSQTSIMELTVKIVNSLRPPA